MDDDAYDLVSLLIGVNNQYQGLSIEQYAEYVPDGVYERHVSPTEVFDKIAWRQGWQPDDDYLLIDGALPQDVDAAMREFGFPMGVFQMQDLAGLESQRRSESCAAARRVVVVVIEIGSE